MPVYQTIYNNIVNLIQNLTNTNVLPRTTHDITVNVQPIKKTYNLRPRNFSISYKV